MRLRFRWMPRALTSALLMLTCLIYPIGAAHGAQRAFVIGNAKYQHTQSLPNPVNDANDVAARLKSLGYDVTVGLDLGRTDFLQAFQQFSKSLGPEDIALIYFAGHALQIGGENYLFPTDALIEKEADARTRLVSLNTLLTDVSRNTRSRIIILDACRNNPFADEIANAQATRSAGSSQGLARVYAGVGSFIAYSTQPGNVAIDGQGRNSPFTDALLRHINLPGADVHAVMRRVRADVQRATAQQQIPWENSSLVDEVTFAGLNPTPGAVSSAPQLPLAKVSPSAPARSTSAAEQFHYVTGLDPKGDNFLALRSASGGEGVRIATMAPDTLLKVLESRGLWRRVQLRDGATGWAHSNWIACCRAVTGARVAVAPMPAKPAADTCDSLWYARNAIWHRHFYCFTSERGQQTFGNSGCSRDEKATRAAMTVVDRETVDALAAKAREMSCR
jgi:Caspase domain/YARHG domain/Bacterial SH3 domain